MKVVTSGYTYLDIDAYGGCIAYAELLQKQGYKACAASTAPFNESVSKTVRTWQAPLVTDYQFKAGDTFTLIDISNPDYADRFVELDAVEAVIDHHPGHETYWRNKIGDRADIEFVGAACTQVYEKWQAADMFDEMSTVSARLLLTGILDNTLNFGAFVTTERDHAAYEALMTRADLPENWPSVYFMECEAGIMADVRSSILTDIKTLPFTSFGGSVTVGQLAVWNGEILLKQNEEIIKNTLSGLDKNWCLNLISIGDGKSMFVADNVAVQAWLTKFLGVQWDGSLAVAPRLWLRKELLKHDIEQGVE